MRKVFIGDGYKRLLTLRGDKKIGYCCSFTVKSIEKFLLKNEKNLTIGVTFSNPGLITNIGHKREEGQGWMINIYLRWWKRILQ